MAKTIKCDKTLALITRSLKAGSVTLKAPVYREYGRTTTLLSSKTLGTPQGAIHSPVLANIFLTCLDNFMESLIEKHNRGFKTRQNTYYSRIFSIRTGHKRTGSLRPQLSRLLSRLLRRQARLVNTRIHDSSSMRINYVRYADDFVISVLGPYKLAKDILYDVSEYVSNELGFTLNEANTGIISFKQGFMFLGTLISSRSHHMKLITKGLNKGGIYRIAPIMNMHAPIKDIQKRLII